MIVHSVLLATLLGLLSGCGGCARDTFPNGTASDIAAPRDAAVLLRDVGAEPDAAMVPHGTKFADGEFAVYGVTEDHYAYVITWPVYRSRVLSLLDGKISDLGVPSRPAPRVEGRYIFEWDDIGLGWGDLRIWNATTGPRLQARLSPVLVGHASDDSRFIFFVNDARKEVGVIHGDIAIASEDGSREVTVARGSKLDADCTPTGRFWGDVLIVFHCPPTDDLGMINGEALLANAVTGDVRSLRRGLRSHPFWVDAKTGSVLASDLSGAGWVLFPDGRLPVALGPDVDDGVILPGGLAVVYRTSRSELVRQAVAANAPPLTLIQSDVRTLMLQPDAIGRTWPAPPDYLGPGLSPDGRWILYSSEVASGGSCTDLFLASTEHPGKPIALAERGAGLGLGDVFTTDGRNAMVTSACRAPPTISNVLVGRPDVIDMGSGAVFKLGVEGRMIWDAGGGRLVYSDQFAAPSNSARGEVSLYWRSVTDWGRKPSVIAQHVHSDYGFDHSLHEVIFGVLGDQPGLYGYQIPD